MIRVCFAGVTGWTAPPILAAIDAADDLTLTCRVSRSAAGRTLADATASRSDGSIMPRCRRRCSPGRVDVLVGYTSAAAVKENVSTAVRRRCMWSSARVASPPSDYAELDRLARDRVWGGCRQLLDHGRDLETGRGTGRAASAPLGDHRLRQRRQAGCAQRDLARARRGPGRGPHPRSAVPLSRLGGPVEARGAEVAGTRIHSVRLPSFVVTTEIVFGGTGERLVMRHDPGESPDPYVGGTLLAIRKVSDVPGVRRGLDSSLIGEKSSHGRNRASVQPSAGPLLSGSRKIPRLRGEPPAGDREPEDWCIDNGACMGEQSLSVTVLPDWSVSESCDRRAT